MKKAISLILSLCLVLSAFTAVPLTVFAEEEPDLSKCIMFDASTTGVEDISDVRIYFFTDVDYSPAKSFPMNIYYNSFKKQSDGTWYYNPERGQVALEEGSQYVAVLVWSPEMTSDHRVYTVSYPLLFDTTCLGDTVYCTGNDISYYIMDDYGWGETVTEKEARWRSDKFGTMKMVDYKGDVAGEVLPEGVTDYDLLLRWFNEYDFTDDDSQTRIDNAAIGLGLTEEDVERAIVESNKTVKWNKNFSTIEGPHTENLIRFEATSTGFDTIRNLTCRFEYDGTTVSVVYDHDRFYDFGDGIWAYDPEANGVTLEESKQYRLTLSFEPVTVNADGTETTGDCCTTYPLLFDTTCLGDTVYCTGNDISYNIWGETITEKEARWRNNRLGPEKRINSYDGNVTGEMIPENTTAYDMLADLLKKGIWNMRNNSGKNEQQFIDDLAIALNLTEEDVERAIAESGMSYSWEKSYSTIAGPHTEKLIRFEATSTGFGTIRNLTCQFSYVNDHNIETVEIAYSHDRFYDLGGGIWAYDPEANGVTLEEGKQYRLTFRFEPVSVNADGTETTGDCCTTYPLLFDTTCLGDTVYCTGNEIAATEYYWSEATVYKEAKWRGSALGPVKQIDYSGSVIGETVPENETEYEMLAFFVKNRRWNSKLINKSEQKMLDDIAVKLGLSEDDVEKAVYSITSDDGKPQWYRYFSNISGGKEDYSDRNVVYVDTSAVSDSVKDYYQTTCTTGIGRYPVIRIDENTWVWSPDVLHYYQPAHSTYDNNGEYIITPAVTSCTLSIGIYVYNDGILQEHPVSSFPCRFDSSCCGDTLVIEESTVTVCDNYNSTTIYNRAHWKNHDNAKYGMIKKYLADDDYTLFGEAETSFRDRVSVLQFYVNNILPKVSPTVIDTDQMLIDAAAEELGMKKGDVRYALNNNSKWNADESELPEGFSYDKGDYYLRRVGDALPYGYYSFMFDAPTQYYALNGSGNEIIYSSYTSSSSSSSSSSSGSTGYVYKPINKFEVVRCDGDESFTTVSREPIATNNASFWFFRPGEDYNFGYNTYGEMREGSSGGSGSSSAYPISAEFPLAPPRITSETNEVGGVTLKWNAVDGAKMYRAFVKGDTDWIAIGDTAETTFTYTGATSGAQSSFMVRCVSSDGTKYLSNMTEDYNGKHYVAAPVVTSTQGLAEGNRICWSAVPGNARFRVFVKSGKSWKALGDTYDTTFVHSSQGDTSIFVQPGTDYTYTVACVSFNGKQVVSGYNKTGWTQLYDAEEREPVPKDDPDKIVDIEMNDPGTGITVSLTDNANGLALSVEPLEDEAVSGAKIDGTLSGVYNISLIKNNAKYQPEARATAAIPCNDPKAKVCRVEDDNSVTDMNAQFSDGALTFELNGPGKYIVTSPAEEPAFTLGDVNGDNKVDITDATMIQKAVAELVELNEAQRKAADVNGDNKVDITDATMIQKYVAEIIDHLG